MASSPPPASRAAGALIALTTVVGALVGTLAGQPSIGVLAGIALGAGGAGLLWWKDRRR